MYSVKQLGNKTSELRKFIKFGYALYKGDENWVAHLFIDTLAMLKGRKNPLFKNGEHAFSWFSMKRESPPDMCSQA